MQQSMIDGRSSPGPAENSRNESLERKLPAYILPEAALGTGASLGNRALWVNTKATGAIERVFSIEVGAAVTGAISIRYAVTGNALTGAREADPSHDAQTSYIGMCREDPGTFEIHPAYQRRRHTVVGASIDVVETTFVPLGAIDGPIDASVVYQTVTLRNGSTSAHRLRVGGFAGLRGSFADDVEGYFDPERRAIVAWNASRPELVRIFGVSVPPTGFATSSDFGRVYDPSHMHPLSNTTVARGDILGCLQLDLRLAPQESVEFSFVTGIYTRGKTVALHSYDAALPADEALRRTIRYQSDALGVAEVLTPQKTINLGALWSKVNMRRVMATYPEGSAFTNEPGVSSNVVIRDVAWFVYGNDHFKPTFSRELLNACVSFQLENGKLPEYYNALDGRTEDNGQNINDDTPLFVLAVNHHFRATGDIAWMRRVYPSVAKAARYIIAQIDKRGLVFCTAKDPRGNVWAIAGWRNVIPLYTLNGAVTELNAECAAALRAAAHLAQAASERANDAAEFAAASRGIVGAMDAHLRNPDNGLYYLNIDADGQVHTDVTGDQIFPVMLRVCDQETGFRIISRLNSPDFWTAAGLRTVSRNDPLYDPSTSVGLLGGVWPGLTWWYAFAAARYHPNFMVEALRSSFAHYAADPKASNTVPGQFSEWFDGETLVNRGMRLSPWEPPRFLWAAVEGVCGIMLTTGAPRINPLVPTSWKWVALRRLPYHSTEISFFAARQDGRFRIYATLDVDSDYETEHYDEDVSARITAYSADAAVVALRREGSILLCVGNVESVTLTISLDISEILNATSTYETHVYNSERDEWKDLGSEPGDGLGSIAISIEAHGFWLVRLSDESLGVVQT